MALNKNEKIGVFIAVVVAFFFLLFAFGLFSGRNNTNSLNDAYSDSDNQNNGDSEEVEKLSITELKSGDGVMATQGSFVTVNYEGFLVDGTKFDSSIDRGEPFIFLLGSGQVIKGWDQGLEGMKVGGVRKLIIPSALGYGSKQAGSIPPNSTLIFEVELLEVQAQ